MAVEQLQDQDATESLDKLGRAINSLLLDEVKAIQLTGQVARPLLLFNLCALLETVALPVVRQGLRDLRQSAEPMEAALRDQGENLYSRLLLAHSVNQAKTPDDEQFWLGLLNDPDPLKVAGGVVGIREFGFETAMKHLPLIEKKHWEHREVLGEFSGEIMLLVDTYADRQWPDCPNRFIRRPRITDSGVDRGLRRSPLHARGRRIAPGGGQFGAGVRRRGQRRPTGGVRGLDSSANQGAGQRTLAGQFNAGDRRAGPRRVPPDLRRRSTLVAGPG